MSAPAIAPESVIQAEIRLALGRLPDVRAWRNNCGILPDRRGIPVHFGVGGSGGSDLIGLQRTLITPEMVGRAIAVFVAAEVKRPGVAVPEHQQRFIDFVSRFGGIAGVVRSPEDALRLVGRERPAHHGRLTR